MVVPGAISEALTSMRVADDEGHRHRLAQRAAEPEHHAAGDPGARVRHHHFPDHFPGRRAEAVGRLLQHIRHGFEHVADHRGNEGQHHDGQDQSRRENADAEWRPLEQLAHHRDRPEHIDQPRLHVLLQEGREHEQAPDAVDDAGDRGQQLDRDTDRSLEPGRRKLGEEDRDPETERHRHEHRNQRRHRACRRSARARRIFRSPDSTPAW